MAQLYGCQLPPLGVMESGNGKSGLTSAACCCCAVGFLRRVPYVGEPVCKVLETVSKAMEKVLPSATKEMTWR